MKIYEYNNKNWGMAFGRISGALRRYAEGVEFVPTLDEADVVIVPIVGNGEEQPCQEALDKKKPLVMWQHCYLTTQDPSAWEKYWVEANLSVSFHDLNIYTDKKINTFSTPLGAEEGVFTLQPRIKRFVKVFATGHVAETEALDKLHDACVQTKSIMVHTGENFKYPTDYQFINYLPDDIFVQALNSTEYVAGLRLIEGFEMMCVEGLFCGARPIVPDLHTYRWYKDFGYFIDVDDGADITSQLVYLFSYKPEPITEEIRQEAVKRFSWKNIIGNVMYRIKESI